MRQPLQIIELRRADEDTGTGDAYQHYDLTERK
jgi:hypothetical protein